MRQAATRNVGYALTAVVIFAIMVALTTLFPLQQRLLVDIPRGSSLRDIAALLKTKGAIISSSVAEGVFRLYNRPLQAGEYELSPQQSLWSVAHQLAEGRVKQHPFTIVEGWQSHDLFRHLRESGFWGSSDYAIFQSEVVFDGALLPDTYFFTRGDRVTLLLERAQAALSSELDRLWPIHENPALKHPDELVILASLIQKEASNLADMRQVSQVLSLRLQNGQRLEVDPTVQFAMSDVGIEGRIHRFTRMEHPFNTYRIHGLPPAPIAYPGKQALYAAAFPASGQALYYVANPSGGHVFSETYEEHRKAIARLHPEEHDHDVGQIYHLRGD